CLAGGLAGAAICLASRSVDGAASTALALAVLLGTAMLARSPRRVRRLATAVGLAVAGSVAAAAWSLGRDRLGDLLRLIGKTPDLTGRTYLWWRARKVMADHRWLGVGYQAFWRPQFADARGLYRYAGIASQSGFHFHNLYVETEVELGVIGLAAVGLTLLAIAAASVQRYDRQPDAPAALMLALVAFLLSRTLLEVDMLEPFSLGWLLLVLVYVMARRLEPMPAVRRPPQWRGEAGRTAAA
ncbi:O-antigen ligase family protein, partial [Sphingomonas bacterium]|uniref:O-antigen ligase family protein n=1 Tax=Sphingomonas bacterium TaxID=1895847 RepID=UPI0015767EAD